MTDLVQAALSTTNSGFPVVKPLLSGIFVPGSTPAQLVRAESWDDFTAQMKALRGDYRLTCFTSIPNMNGRGRLAGGRSRDPLDRERSQLSADGRARSLRLDYWFAIHQSARHRRLELGDWHK